MERVSASRIFTTLYVPIRTRRAPTNMQDYSILNDKTPLPPPAATPEADAALFDEEVWCRPPVYMDYGSQVKFGKDVFINACAFFVDTCLISIGSRTLIGPNVSFYSGAHPLDPEVRNGKQGPETGKEIHVGEDCWLGGNVTVLPGVTIGKGAVVGAGSVVTKVRKSLSFLPSRIVNKSQKVNCVQD
jgi:acetyltransferase-like isoleucine patch superfamily enzyme